MAVFLINECKYFGCGLEFQTLGDLIHHIEDTHIETDPIHLDHQESQRPHSLALSYILRFYTDADPKYEVRPVSPSSSLRSCTPVVSEIEEEDISVDGYESDESTSSNQELTAPLILSMLTRHPGDCDKPIICPIPGCKKSYKNINGMKYHAKNGHKKDLGFVQKTYKCECGKKYKTLHGLKNHNSNCHHTDALTMTSMTLTKTKDMLIATQMFAPKHKAIKHVNLAPAILKAPTLCNINNLLKEMNHDSPVMSSVISSEEQIEVDIVDSAFMDEDSQSLITSEQARVQ